jgi:hypothetical protein
MVSLVSDWLSGHSVVDELVSAYLCFSSSLMQNSGSLVPEAEEEISEKAIPDRPRAFEDDRIL